MTASPFLKPEWLEELSLASRRQPELYLSHSEYGDGPHAAALRVAFRDLGLAAVFCIEGVPSVGFLVLDESNSADVDEVHRALWNQGLMTLLLVIEGDVLRAYSLARLPRQPGEDSAADDRRLVRVFRRVADALELKDLLLGVESGRWWDEHSAAFDTSERVDRVLLDNMVVAARDLRNAGLTVDAAQALLMQAMFIAYLEDRAVISSLYFQEATGGRATSFLELLRSREPILLDGLFECLRRDFNGDIFLAPCAFQTLDHPPKVLQPHMEVLERFREGREVMRTRQGRLWAAYDFRYIPVALISAVYDRFLADDARARRLAGAYYTPMFLADTVVGQVWDVLTDEQRAAAWALDPACGSGIFLVRLFQRMAERRRARRQGRALGWPELTSLIERLHGMDVNPSALRVATFSLYIALLEQVTPPDIRALMARGRMLPELWGRTLLPRTFFGELARPAYDVIIGNPPWTSRRTETGGAVEWCSENDMPCPGGEAAWAFVWKCRMQLAEGGIAGLLLPAMGVLHNHARDAVEARQRLIRENRVERIVNFSDLTFQLFDGADRPAALVLYRQASTETGPYYFDYWCPKADLNLRLKRVLVLSRTDHARLRSDLAAKEPRTFKRRLWMRSPDEKLFQYLSDLPRIGYFVEEYGSLVRRRRDSRTGWVIGQGFQPVDARHRDDPEYYVTTNELVTRLPYLDASAFSPVALPRITGRGWTEETVRRAGFPAGFYGPHILVPQGIERDSGRIRASYTEQDLVFQHSIQAISLPQVERRKAKLLTAVLNSSLVAWFVFHETANFGTDRAKVHQAELLRVPFPLPHDLEDTEAAGAVMDEIVNIVDDAISRADAFLTAQGSTVLEQLDALVFRYFGLSGNEAAVVQDTVRYVVPAMQPSRRDHPALWNACREQDRKAYAHVLVNALGAWLTSGTGVEVHLAALGRDLAVLRLSLRSDGAEDTTYNELGAASEITDVLERIWNALPHSSPGNFQVIPDLRIFLDGDMYMVKPRQMRHWLRSSALADADDIAADLHKAAALNRHGSLVLHAGG